MSDPRRDAATPAATPATGGPWGALRPYFEKEALAAFFVGVSSGFPFAMIGATLTTRLAQDGIDKRTVTAFTLAFLVSPASRRRWSRRCWSASPVPPTTS